MTHLSFTRSAAHLSGAFALVVLLGLLGGCAQMSFPELPPGLTNRPQPAAETQPSPEDEAAGAVAETIEPPEPTAEEPTAAKPKPGKLYEWSGDGRQLTRIIIDTNEQTARFFAGDDPVGWSTVATGVANHPTPRGEFSILEKVRDKRSNLYGKIVARDGRVLKGSAHSRDRVPAGARFVGANMPNFMRMTYDGIGMHAGPIPNPGSPASHGCIRMPPTLAEAVFAHVGSGTAVTVVGNGPDYGNYAERIAREQAEQRARRAAAEAAKTGTGLDALDAEIKAMEESGVETPPATGTKPADPQSRTPAQAREQPPAPGATAGSGAAASDAARAEQAPADARANAETDAAKADRAAPEPRRSESKVRADAANKAAPAATPGPEQPGRESAPAADMPAEAPTEADPPYYEPPAPPPTIRSAGAPVSAAARG
ncbi:L,D-transpeptidase [Thiohalocapsa sp. ML1]|jgi:lipoprotein-anchoring transpeptidase ErfK/SrfK|uniref:L,D-transpeptidase n=1 Tax=Thiohalocapsa sp. ML1 TaxID=1431688 RepID=UPI000731F87A|nr:L,D-transpeptidase [Thiohalocapsa sp. ML1]